MFALSEVRTLKYSIWFASLILVCTCLAARSQNARGEPIAFIGHGAMFDQNGREVAPSIEFIREAQAWYRNDLLAKLTKDELARFEDLEGRLTEGLTLDQQSQLVLDSHLLDWLIRTVPMEDRERVLGKNSLMKDKLEAKLPEKPESVGLLRSHEPFRISEEFLRRLATEDLIRADRPDIVSLSETNLGGQAYTEHCRSKGVPIPPDWKADESTGWVNRGLIASADLFIKAGMKAEVFTYESPSPFAPNGPEGMCIALPRYYSKPGSEDIIDLLGVICLGKVSKKACFWDIIGFDPPYNDLVEFNKFRGGTDLPYNDTCTDCHAGENPYIIHPDTVLGGLAALGLPIFADDWYEPIVQPGWPQNEAWMNSPAACVGCHTAGGSGGRFPHLSNNLEGYCDAILKPAIGSAPPRIRPSWVPPLSPTMPEHSPGSEVPDGVVSAQMIALQAWCDVLPANDASGRGDPHMTTFDGVNYDFQSAGEFVYLRGADGLEVQVRQTPVATISTGPNAHTGLASCVSLNTAVAARVGTHRVTFQPNFSGVPDPSGLQLRVDGEVTKLGAQGLDLGSGGRVMSSAVGGGIEIDFSDGTHLIATPGWWGAPQNQWYLNVDIIDTRAREGVLGPIAPGSWLPALPNGASLGPRPAALHERYVDLNQRFADAWRVSDWTSLFDYAPGTSTATFTLRSWPPESPPCVIPDTRPVKPLNSRTAQRLCRSVVDKHMNADCVFDVTVTGERGFAKTYLLTQQLRSGSTRTTVSDDRDPTQAGSPVTFTATVESTVGGRRGSPSGTVQFILDGTNTGPPIRLAANGQALGKTTSLEPGDHRIAARYSPARNSVFLASSSLDEPHTVKGEECATRVLVAGIHYPSQTCAESRAAFHAGMLTSFHFTSKCTKEVPLRAVFDVSCQDAPIPGFATGSVYQGTACCGKAAIAIGD